MSNNIILENKPVFPPKMILLLVCYILVTILFLPQQSIITGTK